MSTIVKIDQRSPQIVTKTTVYNGTHDITLGNCAFQRIDAGGWRRFNESLDSDDIEQLVEIIAGGCRSKTKAKIRVCLGFAGSLQRVPVDILRGFSCVILDGKPTWEFSPKQDHVAERREMRRCLVN